MKLWLLYGLLSLTLISDISAQQVNTPFPNPVLPGYPFNESQYLRISVNNNSPLEFSGASDLDNGLVISGWLKITIYSSTSWKLTVQSISPYAWSNNHQQQPVSIFQLKASNSNLYVQVRSTPQSILRGSGSKFESVFYIDLQANPGWDYGAGNYIANLIFTLTSQ
ncbi:MAG: hypothetical protein K2X48_16320 [Chitinophagaceae bacterium]|nr:hypothetical protein [Chitinophagaceae bacterium]